MRTVKLLLGYYCLEVLCTLPNMLVFFAGVDVAVGSTLPVLVASINLQFRMLPCTSVVIARCSMEICTAYKRLHQTSRRRRADGQLVRMRQSYIHSSKLHRRLASTFTRLQLQICFKRRRFCNRRAFVRADRSSVYINSEIKLTQFSQSSSTRIWFVLKSRLNIFFYNDI